MDSAGSEEGGRWQGELEFTRAWREEVLLLSPSHTQHPSEEPKAGESRGQDPQEVFPGLNDYLG